MDRVGIFLLRFPASLSRFAFPLRFPASLSRFAFPLRFPASLSRFAFPLRFLRVFVSGKNDAPRQNVIPE
jgi:hypothetical protein